MAGKKSSDSEKSARINEELIQAGFTTHGLKKGESKHLPQIIHDDEHVLGAVYGSQKGTFSAMLVATDRRIIYLDHKPLYTVSDELTYDVVSGIKQETTAFATNVILFTRVGNYSLRFVNPVCATKFEKAVEKLRLEAGHESSDSKATIAFTMPEEPMDERTIQFLRTHEIGVLSSIKRTGEVGGAVVYYVIDESNNIYILTKFGTSKVQNVLTHHQVALTVFDEAELQTVQLEGLCEIETNTVTRKAVYQKIVKLRSYAHGSDLPPITKIDQPAYVVLKIHPLSAKFSDFKSK